MSAPIQPGTLCDGFTRTGEHNLGAHIMERCKREAEFVCTTPESEGYQVLCRHHKAAWLRKPYFRRYGIVERIGLGQCQNTVRLCSGASEEQCPNKATRLVEVEVGRTNDYPGHINAFETAEVPMCDPCAEYHDGGAQDKD